jgi:hypothetical protein
MAMKLRIRGNSLRLRVSKNELTSIAERGMAEDAARFSPVTELRYRLEVKPAGAIEAHFGPALVRVVVPKPQVDRWMRPDEVSIEGEQAVGGGEVLRILVEKDYTCLTPRSGEDDSDLFANPQKAAVERD